MPVALALLLLSTQARSTEASAQPAAAEDAPASSQAAEEPPAAEEHPAASEPEAFDVFSIFEEEQTVSTGATRALTLREAPTNVWVLDRQTLDRQPMLNLYDALRMVPGVNIIEYTLGHGEANLRFIGSFPEHQSLTLVDGRAVASDAVGYFDYSLVDLQTVERVEVVLGPSSTIYGANAFSGVVNIVTRKPVRSGNEVRLKLDTGLTTSSPGAAAREPLDAGALVQGHASYGTGWGSGGLRLTATGLFAQQQGGAQGNYRPLIIGDPVRQGSASLDVVQDTGGFELRLQATAALKKSPYLFFELSDAEQRDYAVSVQAERTGLAGRDDRLTLNVWAKHNRVAFAGTYAGIETIPFVLDTTSAEARASYTLPTFANNSLTIGAQARGIFVTPNAAITLSEPGRRQLLAGIFIEDMYRPVQPLLITGGVRVDTREMAATRPLRYLSFSPRLSLNWLINDDHSLRLEYASAFRTPTALERGIYVDANDGVPIVVGNLNLDNERVHSVTLSYTGRKAWFSSRVEVWAQRTIGNIIPALSAATSPATDVQGQPLFDVDDTALKYPFYFYNAPGFWIPGASAKFAVEPNSQLRVSLVYTFMPSPLSNRVGLIADWQPTPRLSFAAQAFYYGHVNSSSLFQYPTRLIFNAQAAVHLDGDGKWTAALNVMNAGDVRLPSRPIEGSTQLYRESIAGGRVGPRAWVSVSYVW